LDPDLAREKIMQKIAKIPTAMREMSITSMLVVGAISVPSSSSFDSYWELTNRSVIALMING